jgi:hypothetical protein
MSSTEVENVVAPETGVRSCAKGLSQSSGLRGQETAVPVAKTEAPASSKPSICFEAVLSGNGYDYLGP